MQASSKQLRLMVRLVPMAALLLAAPLTSIGPVRASWALELVASASSTGADPSLTPTVVAQNRAQALRQQAVPTEQMSVSLDGSQAGLGYGLTGSISSNGMQASGQLPNGFNPGLSSNGNNLAASQNGNMLLPNQISASDLLELGQNPFGSGIRYLAPNTYQSALESAYQMLSNGANRGFGQLSSGLSNLGDSSMNRLQSVQNSVTNRYMSSEEMMRRLYDMVSDPQQMCRQLAEQGQTSLQNVQQQASNQAESAGSILRRLGNMSFG